MQFFRKKTCPAYQIIIVFTVFSLSLYAQPGQSTKWGKDGNSYYELKDNEIIRISLPDEKRTVIIPNEKLIPSGYSRPLFVRSFSFSADEQKILIYTNTQKVWRYDTRGDYWLYTLQDGSLLQLGKSLPA